MEYLGLASVAYFSCLLLASLGAGLPTYQSIVYPELFDERKDEGVRVLKINEDLTLNLEQSSVLHEDFFIRTYRQGVPQHTYYDVEALQEDLYHDKRRLAAVFLSEEDGTLKVVRRVNLRFFTLFVVVGCASGLLKTLKNRAILIRAAL
ncbi:hypothetical protein V5799_006402 [Amblyomma americanum]|uniref:Secreted metalloprotease n=2 Tax=Amblyomma americanum TaxID=6943 RepID=A0AAQ4DWH7_AMBAM